jgi:hypothetical protein
MQTHRELTSHTPVAISDRMLAAVSYIGALGLIVFAAVPARQFLARHNRLAVAIHVIRLGWVGGALGVWWLFADHPEGTYSFAHYGADLAMLLIVGVPWQSTMSTTVVPWIATPLVVTWVFSLCGLMLAAAGRTADFYAFTHADWSDVAVRRMWLTRNPEEERQRARSARERQLERLQQSNRMVSTERQRRSRIVDLEDEITQLEAQRGHNDQLLSVGEISRERHQRLQAEIDAEMADLASQIHEIQSRIAMPASAMPERLRVHRMERGAESPIDTLAIVTPDGIPLFTYGHFVLDEALVAGILSAFDSLSEEVFGSRVRKTSLAEGKVLHFAHGQYVVILAIFIDEPSPRQVEQLRKMLQQFEAANHGPLARKAWDPAYLHEVQIPFRFVERLPRS